MALPNTGTIAYTREVRDTGDPISQSKPLFIGQNVWLNDPNENKLLSWVMRDAEKVPVYNHIFGHLEDAPFPNWVIYDGDSTGVSETSQDTDNLTITGVQKRCATGTRLVNARTKEVVRLDADPDAANTTQGVSRNFGRGTAADLMIKGDRLFILPAAMYEGYTVGKGMSNVENYVSFSTGSLSYPVKIADVEQAEKSRVGSPFERALFKSWKQSKDQMEAAVLYSAEKISSSASGEMHTMTGINDFISTNVWTVNGTLSRKDLWDILLEMRLFYKGDLLIACSSFFKAMITEWAMGKVEYNQDTATDGLAIENIKCPAGTFSLTDVDLLNQEQNLMGEVFFIPQGKTKYCPLIENLNLDIQYRPINEDEKHLVQGEISGEVGFEYHEEETWGHVTGIEF